VLEVGFGMLCARACRRNCLIKPLSSLRGCLSHVFVMAYRAWSAMQRDALQVCETRSHNVVEMRFSATTSGG
jgi:hypothetical protein